MSWNNNLNKANWAGNPVINNSNAVIPDNLIVSSIQTNYLSTAVISVSSINANYISSATANIPNLNVSTINGRQLSNYSASNWSYYPALTQVEMNYNNLHNAGNINMKGNFSMAGTGNLVSNFWYNAQIDANIKTGASGNLFNPTNVQYFSDYSVKNVNVDVNYGVYSYETASHRMYAANILPVGRNVLNAKNFNLSLPYSGFLAGNYRGYGELSVDGGDGTSCYLKLNPDIVTTSVANTAALSYYNGDSYLASITELGVSRVGVTFGRVINLATYEARLTAGYVGTLNSYLPVCEILSYAPAGGAGGGTTCNVVNGGAFGARNDMVAYNNYSRGGGGATGVVMDIGSRGILNLYSGSNLLIGYNTSNYFNDNQGDVFIYNIKDMYVRNIYGVGGSNIEVRNNMDLLSNVLYAGGIETPDLYVATIHNNLAGAAPIYVVNDFDMGGNNINQVTSVNGFNNENLNIQTPIGSNGTLYLYGDSQVILIGATGAVVICPSNNLDMNFNDIINVNTLHTNAIQQDGGSAIVIRNDLDMTNHSINNIQTVNAVDVNANAVAAESGSFNNLYTNGNTSIAVNAIIDMCNNDIDNIKGAYASGVYTNNLYTNTDTLLTVHNDLDFGSLNSILNAVNVYGASGNFTNTNTDYLQSLTTGANIQVTNSMNFGFLRSLINVKSIGPVSSIQGYNFTPSQLTSLGTQIDVLTNLNMAGNNIKSINNLSSYEIYTQSIYTANLGQPNGLVPTPIRVNNELDLQNNNIYAGNIISATNISTLQLLTKSISSINANISTIRNFNISTTFIQASSITATNTITASTIAGDTFGTSGLGQYMTGNWYPKSAGVSLGFFGSSGTNSGGFFGSVLTRSTITQTINPDIQGAYSNNIKVFGHLSTQNVFVSSINNKQYPYTSTLNTPPSTFSYAASNTQSRTIPYVLYSNVAFPNAGWFNISQKAIFTRASGASDTHQSVFYTPGAFISTPSIVDGYAVLPYVNQNNNSTFTTLTTELYISSTQLNRNITLYNDTNNNFVGNLFMDRLVATYNPSRGINPE